MMEQNHEKYQSLHADISSFVTFISRTNRKVDIFWIDYKGKHVKYATLNNYGDQFPITTFVTHPWTFKDAETGDSLVYKDNQSVYFPKPHEDNNLYVVLIGIPVYSLRDRCLQVVRRLFQKSQIEHLHLPNILKSDLSINTEVKSIMWDEYENVGGSED